MIPGSSCVSMRPTNTVALFSALFDTLASLQHPTDVLTCSRRLSALLLTLALSAGHMVECAGWMATPEARMACCTKGGACPMHKSDSRDSGSPWTVSQSEADRCCAASEQDTAAPAASGFIFSVSLGVIPSPVQLVVPATAARPDAWRDLISLPGTPVPKYLLLSVFLV